MVGKERCLKIFKKMGARIEHYFATDNEVKKLFGESATLTSVAPNRRYTTLARQLCADVAAENSCKHLISADHVAMPSDKVMEMIRDICTESRLEHWEQQARNKASVTIELASPTDDEPSTINITISRYIVPIAYKLIGKLATPSSSLPMYAVALVWEKHCVAFLDGTVVCNAKTNQYTQRDCAILDSLKNMTCKENADKFPLPIADFLCQCVLKTRNIAMPANGASAAVPSDVRTLLFADEIVSRLHVEAAK